MKQPTSHKDIDFGQTLYAVTLISDKTAVLVSKKTVATIEKSGWKTDNNSFIKYCETFYTIEDAIECAAAFFALRIKVVE